MDWPALEKTVSFRTSRASGAGGQHVNKTETRVEATVDLLNSDQFSASQKKRLKHHLRKRLRDGTLSVVDASSRSQHTNKARALNRLRQLVENGLRPIPKKRKAKSFTANRRKRLEGKKRRSELKANRSKRWY